MAEQKPTKTEDRTEPPRRVAVVAVHGVADQQPGATARRIARLLAGLRRNGDYVYQAPTEIPIQIGVKKPPVEPPATRATAAREEDKGKSGPSYGDRSFIQPTVLDAIARGDREGEGDSKAEGAVARPDTAGDAPGEASEFEAHESLSQAGRMAHEVLQGPLAATVLPVEDEVWETLRIETSRRDMKCETHVYEMYWADLSRLGNRLLSPLLGLYQLLFFLPALGSRTLAFARACMPEKQRKGWIWRAWAVTNGLAMRALAWGFPVLTLLLVAMLVVVLAIRVLDLPGDPDRSLLPYVPSALAVAALVFALYRWRQKIVLRLPGMEFEKRWPGWLPWPLRIVFPLLLTAVAVTAWISAEPDIRWAALALWVAAAAGVLMLLWRYDLRLHRVFASGLGATLALSGIVVVAIFDAATVDQLTSAVTMTSEQVVRRLYWSLWLAFSLAFLLNMLLGFLAGRRARGNEDRVQRVRWTVDLSLALTAPVILLTNLALWAVLLWASESFLTPSAAGNPSFLQQALSDEWISWWREILHLAIPPLFVQAWLPVLLLALLLTLWSVWPAVRADAHRRRGVAENFHDSIWSGTSLSKGFVAARVGGELVRWGLVCIALPLSAVYYLGFEGQLPESYLHVAPWLLLALAAGFAAAVLGRGPLAFLAFGFRAALDIAFDVVNWLRSDPPKQTTSGRILSRYFSLLRHLASWRHPQDGGHYSAVVVVAHSQGAVIAAEGLRFRLREPAVAAETDCPCISLLTMGAPLHQLYGLRFPFRYHWAWSAEPAIWPSSGNDPTALGVRYWWNVYHSGDYVGRSLWHPATAAGSELPYDHSLDHRDPSHDPVRRERCLGAGGHNTYWDGHSRHVAGVLDELIDQACTDG